MLRAVCPDCKREIELGPEVRQDEWVDCPHCQASLQLINLDPPELDWAYEGSELAGAPWIWSTRARWGQRGKVV